MGIAKIAGVFGIMALSASAALLARIPMAERVIASRNSYALPASADISRTLLPDGRVFEVHGAQGWADLIDSPAAHHRVTLPQIRRFASVTVMPTGHVLLWGGMDAQGHVLATGEWFEPGTQRFIHAAHLNLPARAAHTLTVLTDGRLLMTGGLSTQGTPATTALLWDPRQRQIAPVIGSISPRLEATASTEADGSVSITGGVDLLGQPVRGTLRFDPVTQTLSPDTRTASAPTPEIATFPVSEAKQAPLQGPLAIRFNAPVDMRQLTGKTVTLLGPAGVVPTRVVGVEGGRLAFVQLPDDLYPGSRYTLFVQGLHRADDRPVPYTAVGFTTATLSPGVEVAGHGSAPLSAGSASYAVTGPALHLMAGGDHETSCSTHEPDQLCRAHSFIRDGAWYPGQNNAPDATGAHWRLYQRRQTLPDTRSLAASLAKGATALIGQVRQIDETPVGDVEVSIGGIKTRTNAQGLFVLDGLTAGRGELFIDGRTANHGAKEYGRFLVGADIKANAVNHMPFVMYLPRVLPRDKITLPSPTSREVVLTHPDMPGLELHIPAGTVLKDREGHVLTHIAIVPTPVDRAPFPLPDNFPMYFTIQPGDAVVQGLDPRTAQGVRVVYPNYGHAKPNTSADFWVYNVKSGWQMYGSGHVSADAKHLAPDPGVSVVWALGAGASLNNTSPPGGRTCNGTTRSQPVDLQTGMFFHEWNDLAIRDVVPLTLTRAYRSDDNGSHAFGIGGNSNYGIHIYSADGNFSAPEVVMPCGEGIVFNLVSGSLAWPFTPATIWEHTATNSAFYGATLQFLFDGTSDGAHWILTMKDGTEYAFTRHAPNQLAWMQDRYGNLTQMNYNGGLLDQVVSPSGRSIVFGYDSGNRIVSATDNTSRQVSYAYGSGGTLSTVTYPDQTTEQYTYDGANRMLTMQDRRGNVWVSNHYDVNGRIDKQTLADQTYYQFAYATNSGGAVTATTVTDPNGHQEHLTFDPVSKYPLTDTFAYGTSLAQTTAYVREASGLVDSTTDALNRTTAYTYDDLGNVTKVTRLAGTANATSYQYSYTSDFSQLASITDPLGHTSTMSYENGCLSGITDSLNHSTTILCNSAGQISAIEDPLGHITTLSYQGYDLESLTDGLGRSTLLAVDALGRPTAVKDPLGIVTLAQYDTNDRVVQVTDGLNQSTTVSYDGNGNPTGVTLPSSAAISETYDLRNRPLTHTDALGQVDSWTYDGMGDVMSHTDRKQQVTMYSYDALNRRTLVSYADGSGTQASYDAGNRVTQLLDTNTGSLSWGYDGLDRVTAAVTPQGTISYGYDAAGRRTSMTPAAQAIVNYVYDNANRLTSLSQGSETVQFGYDASNRRTSLVLPNGIGVAYAYDDANQLTGINYTTPSQTPLGALAYGYDADGRRVSKTGSFATDILPTPTTQNGVFDLNNRQTTFNSGALSYDANGNLTSDGVNTYTWNARNQLSEITAGGTVQASYTYDALGRRAAKAMSGITPTQYLYDGANAVQETLGNTINPILTGLGTDERFARNDVTGRTYFLTDALGSTLALTDPTGAIRQRYNYDPYGTVTQMDNSTGFTNPYLYTGREADAPGLYYYRARYYSPMLGRFISEDPLGFRGGQSNLYAYAGSSPVMYVDPYGLWSSGASFYAGVGGGVTFGVDPNDGGFFITFSFGFGLGDSINLYTPSGSRPGSKAGDCSHARIGLDLFAGVGSNIGPVGAGLSGNLGRTFYPGIEKDSEAHGGIAPTWGVDWAWKQELQAAAGGQITLGY
ncbi:RHS repeat-associated core domain-containing protein [Rhodanobacter umsongensis]|uniref:RHS repeat-associated core domain-containing protein n=1 Tax=Rhodanobacter umsongensis TaxID=633153 RepID=A0ABW0JRD8_9GAMM